MSGSPFSPPMSARQFTILAAGAYAAASVANLIQQPPTERDEDTLDQSNCMGRLFRWISENAAFTSRLFSYATTLIATNACLEECLDGSTAPYVDGPFGVVIPSDGVWEYAEATMVSAGVSVIAQTAYRRFRHVEAPENSIEDQAS